jgi:hypothetical protein
MGWVPQDWFVRQGWVSTNRRSLRRTVALSIATTILAASAVATTVIASATVNAPTTPSALVCGNSSVLDGPSTAPAGAVTVPAGDDSGINLGQANTTYYFATGTHTLGSTTFSQIIPGTNSSYIGAPGAIISGQDVNSAAFTQGATGVTIEHLTIEGFEPPNNEDAVNHDSGRNWTIEYNTIQNNGTLAKSDGYALGMGSGDIYENNCLTANGQGALNGYAGDTENAITGAVLDNNEISWNGSSEFPDVNGCGCSGGVKFFFSTGTEVENNYFHDNWNVGLWFDTDNVGALVTGNYFARNWAGGINYEASHNADISDNTFVDNAWGTGSYSENDFPAAAIYISASGGEPALDGGTYSNMLVQNNLFQDNWGGVVLFQSPNRYCGDGFSEIGGNCPDANPAVATATTCVDPGLQTTPLSTDCQYRVANITVSGNTFDFNPANIEANETVTGSSYAGTDTLSGTAGNDETPSRCATAAYDCGYNALFSTYGCQWVGCGSSGSASPYYAWAIPDAIMTPASGNQPSGEGAAGQRANVNFSSNTYSGPWSFQAYSQGGPIVYSDVYPKGVQTGPLTLAQWQSVWGQDVSSAGGAGTTTTLSATTTTADPPPTTTQPPPTTTQPPPTTTQPPPTTTQPPPTTTQPPLPATTDPPPTTTDPPPTTTQPPITTHPLRHPGRHHRWWI